MHAIEVLKKQQEIILRFLMQTISGEKIKCIFRLKSWNPVPSVGVVFCDYSVFSEDGYKEDFCFRKGFPFFHEHNFTLDDIFQNKYKLYTEQYQNEIQIYYGNIARYLCCENFVLPSSAVIRKSVFEKLGGFDESYKIAEETEYFLRLCTFNDAAYVDLPLVDYMIKRIGNLTGSSNTERLIRNAIDIQKKYLSVHREIYLSNKLFYNMAIAKSHTRLAYYFLTMKMNKASRLESKCSISWMPYQFKAYSYWLLSFCPQFLLGVAGRSKQFLKALSRWQESKSVDENWFIKRHCCVSLT